MFQGPRYSFWRTIWWTRHTLFIMMLYALAACSVHHFLKLPWLTLPWQPVGLIGVALAFYLGFKNNSAYDRLWEARKIDIRQMLDETDLPAPAGPVDGTKFLV
ncbi:MAG: bestrophin family ion channel [Myxococcota bacterium]